MHGIKKMGDANKVKLLTIVTIGVLENDGTTNVKEVNGGLNTSSRSVNGVSIVESGSMGR